MRQEPRRSLCVRQASVDAVSSSLNPDVLSILNKTAAFLEEIHNNGLPFQHKTQAFTLSAQINNIICKYNDAAPPSVSVSESKSSLSSPSSEQQSPEPEPVKPDQRNKVLRKRNATPEPEESEGDDGGEGGNFVCKECGDQFEHGQALGGHMSRKHPGQSLAFNKKVQRRKEREFERELLHHAKLKHSQLFGEDKPLDRVKIRRYRKELRKQFHLTGKFSL